jgi:hypothetical protein
MTWVVAWMNSVLSRIVDGTLLPTSYYGQLDCDAALVARDGDEFDAAWVRQYEEVERRWAEAGVPAEARTLAEDIRRESFLAVTRATRQHEIACYVSDDFDLIIRARLVGIEGDLIGQLWEAYDRGKFPRKFNPKEPS